MVSPLRMARRVTETFVAPAEYITAKLNEHIKTTVAKFVLPYFTRRHCVGLNF